MSRDGLEQRFGIDLGYAGDGRSFVRVLDTVTGAERTQVSFDGEAAEVIARRLAGEMLGHRKEDVPVQ